VDDDYKSRGDHVVLASTGEISRELIWNDVNLDRNARCLLARLFFYMQIQRIAARMFYYHRLLIIFILFGRLSI
jgi:hypothetical protein